MPSVHGYPTASFKAGTGCNTSTAIYKAVYLSGDNEVAICNTITNYGAFIGVTQDYVDATGQDIPVAIGGATKAILKGASITAGNLVGIAVGTSTALGHVAPHAVKSGDTPTAGAMFILGKCVVGSQGGTDTVCEVLLNPYLATVLTTTLAT